MFLPVLLWTWFHFYTLYPEAVVRGNHQEQREEHPGFSQHPHPTVSSVKSKFKSFSTHQSHKTSTSSPGWPQPRSAPAGTCSAVVS